MCILLLLNRFRKWFRLISCLVCGRFCRNLAEYSVAYDSTILWALNYDSVVKRNFLRLPPHGSDTFILFFFMQLPFTIYRIHYPFSLFYKQLHAVCVPLPLFLTLSISLSLPLSHPLSLVFLLNSAFKFSWPKGCPARSFASSLSCFLSLYFSLTVLLSLCAPTPSCVDKCFAFYFISRFRFVLLFATIKRVNFYILP